MEVHSNLEGVIHVHGCPIHPNGSAESPVACRWEHSEHDDAFRAEHKDKYDKAKVK